MTTPATTDNGPDHYPVPISDKPLNQGQAKNLAKIVELDFQDLRSAVFGEINRMADAKLSKLQAMSDEDQTTQASTELADAHLKAITMAKTRLLADIEKLAKKYPGVSFQKVIAGVNTRHVDFTSGAWPEPGMAKAISRVKEARNRLTNSAALIMNREKRSIDRLILVQTISSPSAAELMRDLPKAEDILTLIRSELEANNDGDIETLLSDDFDAEQYIEAATKE